MGWFSKAVKRGIEDGVEAGVKRGLEEAARPGGALDQIVSKTLGLDLPDNAPLNRTQFLFAMAQRFAQAGVKRADEARSHARDTLAAFLAGERIEFGDPAYVWDRNAAREVAFEYELREWVGG